MTTSANSESANLGYFPGPATYPQYHVDTTSFIPHHDLYVTNTRSFKAVLNAFVIQRLNQSWGFPLKS